MSDDRWGFRVKRQEFLERFGFPGTPAGDRMERALGELTDALLQEARYHATWPVATAEKWRYDRMLWTFGVMLGEITADTPPPPADDLMCHCPGYRGCDCDPATVQQTNPYRPTLAAPTRCQRVSASPWGPTQCALPEGHGERHAYSPSETLAATEGD